MGSLLLGIKPLGMCLHYESVLREVILLVVVLMLYSPNQLVSR